ncbi:glycosyltransferase family 4 protein [Schinkia azotoformans]|uniref:Putative glycosyltransferase n=1 Tax=Schinkia azotoformans LMG 9581 TaxID=1131731 RepID=K6D3Y2_SCHAZ|nr:glycosyltransferase family 4 protein [Schinkia azotoformans]EKN62763.1 putative glycosyltransferase [Schinkia azotoformans LMG 9581]MEC1639139.1 glycosyltransferase family 4 protein [Schinkia azotoformans]MEC1945727.1 glycosyltransferase family 4 protein [Schinkia azotoformans]
MKKIAIITAFVALPGEKGYSRFEFLSNFLSNNGYEVDLITSTFQHWEKKKRDIERVNRLDTKYNIVLIDELGYHKNVDYKRILSHRKFAQNLKDYLYKEKKYDLIYCIIPDNHIAVTAAEYSKKHNIPFVIDVEDLWPEAMKMVIDIPIINDLFFYPFKLDAKKVYKMCDAVVGTSDEYRDRPFKDTNRKIPNITVYVGNEISEFDAGVKKYLSEIDKSDNEFWVSYAGNIGTSYDIKTMILASEELKRRGYSNIKVMLMGGGPLKEDLEQLSKSINCNVEFVGYLPYQKMAAYLSKSDIVVNSFVKKAPQSIVTKIGDYLASGKPMINTCSSPEFKSKVENDGFGVNIEAEDVNILADAIENLYNNKALCEEYGRNARKVAEEQFDRPKSYLEIVNLINKLLEENR